MKSLKANVTNKKITALARLSNVTGGVYKPDKPKRIENKILAPVAYIAESTAVNIAESSAVKDETYIP